MVNYKKHFLLGIGIFFLIACLAGVASANTDWLIDWDYRTPIEIDGNTEELTDYQVQITLQGTNYSAANYVDFGKVLANGADIRFTDSDKTTEIDFWIEEWVNRTWDKILIDDNHTYTDGAHNILPYDLDGDGQFELIANSYKADSLQFYKYSGDPTNASNWTRYVIDDDISPGSNSNAAHYTAIIDINSDGRVDLVSAENLEDEDVVAYLAPVDITNISAWERHVLYDFDTPSWGGAYHIDAGDIDGNDTIDIAVSMRYGDCRVGWLNNNGSADNWDITWIDTSIGQPFNVKIADFDKDGQNDIVASSMDDSKIYLYNYSGDPTNPDNWSRTVICNLTGSFFVLHVADVDQDNDLDILFVRNIPSGPGKTYLLENPYPGNIKTEWTSYLIGDHDAREIDVGDIDNDGDLDVVIADSPRDAVIWFENNGTTLYENWEEHTIDIAPDGYLDWAHGVGMADIDNNGYLDVAVASAWGDSFYLYFNNVGNTKTFVEIPNIPSSSTKTIYMYYGNSGASSASNFDNTFTKDYGESGLAALWHFDDSTSPTIDSSGNGNSGTVHNATWVGSDGGQWNGRSDVIFSTGDSLEFDGDGDYVNVPHSESINITGAFTVAGWVKGEVSGTTRWASKFDLTWSWWFGTAGGKVRFLLRSPDPGYVYMYKTGDILLSNDEWYHVVGVFLPSDDIKVYVNGVEDTGTLTGTVSTAVHSSTDDIYIAREGSVYFDGAIDGLRIYNRSLSLNEIQAHYERRKYTSTEPAATTTSAFRGYDKIFTRITNTISATDYVSYSVEPSVSNLVNMTTCPSQDSINITILNFTTTYKKWNESSSEAGTYAFYVIGDTNANTNYAVNIYAHSNDTKMQTFYIVSNSSGYVGYNTTGFGYDRYTEVIPIDDPIPAVIVVSVVGAVVAGGAYVIRKWKKKIKE